MFRPLLTSCASLAAWLAAASLASAQTNISGALSGSLGPGVYHCTGNISVAPSTTLTIAAGTVIKFNLDQLFTIDGTLTVNGIAGNKVYFTDINDDTVGGDSNGNGGATTPAANWSAGLQFNSNADASSLANFEVRYGGRNSYAGIELDNADLTLTGGAVRSCQGNGLDLNNLGGHPTVTGCTFTSNLGAAIVGANLDAVPGFTNCTATSNGGNYLAVSNGTLGINATIGSTKGIGGVVYVPVNASVPSGKTLALQAGAILKFGIDNLLTVDGTLSVTGTSGNKVYFTDVADDSVGGDTNTNGASSGAANWWRGLQFNSTSSASSLTQFEVRYGGRNGYSGISIVGSNASFSNGVVRDCQQSGIHLNNTAALPTFASCSVQNCLSYAIRGLKFDALPGFTNNTATGNGNNLIEVVDGTLTTNLVVGPTNGIGGVVFFSGSMAVPASKSLTLQAGTIFKFGLDNLATIDGTLTANGASGNRVIFTDFNDDVGTDTNNSAMAPAANWWRGLVFNSGASASSLTQFEVRYGGRNGYSGVEITSCNPTLTNGTVRDCNGAGIDLNNSVAFPTISGCAVQNCSSFAIRRVKIDALPDFTNNTATGNTNNAIEVVDGTLVADQTIGPSNGINGVFYFAAPIGVPATKTLALQAGTIIKLSIDQLITIDGTLVTTGASGNPVIFTDFNDDVGGDSNGNGNATVPAANWWRGLVFNGTADASSIDFAEVRYGGRNGYAGIEIVDADITLTRSIVRNCQLGAIDLNGTTAKPRINRCSFQSNIGRAITGVRIDAVPFITRNTATGNTFDHMWVTNGTPTSDLFLLEQTGVNGAIVMATSINVPPGIRMRLAPSVVIKFDLDLLVTVDGELDVEGTATRPVTFTEYRDDTIGGDSNGDSGASLPGANFWRGLVISSGATGSSIEGLVVRYAGRNGYAGIYNASPLTTLDRCRVSSCQQQGFVLLAAARADFLTAWNNIGAGFRLDSGAFDLRHATVQGCPIGIQKNGAWTGSVASSIAWGNTTNYSSLAAGQVRYSDGFVGGTGNLNVDPLFVNTSTGDLHLQLGSPCIGTGDPLSPVDPDCSAPDMGAFPGAGTPFTYCAGKANSVGCTPFMTFSGFASTSSSQAFEARCYNVLNNKNGLFYYGFNGQLSGPFQGGTKCVAPPTIRLPLMNSNGNALGNDCSGSYAFDFNALVQGGTDPMLVTGATVNVQCWYRDPQVPSATGLSDGLQFDICN